MPASLRSTAFDRLQALLSERILILDGAMGTMLQRHHLTEAQVRGERFASHHKDLVRFSDILCLTHPDKIIEIHRQYLAVFRQREDRVRVLWALARALLGSAATFARLWDERSRLSVIPSLIVWGLGDRALPPELLERFRQALPHAGVHALDGVGHWPQEEAPERVAELLDGFLPRTSGGQAKLRSA